MNWSYIAGFFDGEGNLHVNKVQKSYSVLIRFYNTNKEVLEEIKEFIKVGSVYTYRKTNELTIRKKEDCYYVLKEMLPFLIVKKQQAKYLFDNFDFESGIKTGGHNNLDFDIDKFHTFITRKGAEKYRKNHNAFKPLTE